MTIYHPQYCQHTNGNKIVETIRLMRRGCNKKDKSKRAASSCIENYVDNLQLPVNGLYDLKMAVRNRMSWVKKAINSTFDKAIYDAFMELLYAAIYVYAPQGRVSGLTSLSFKQAKELVEEGQATTNKFKTNIKYGYQVVLVNDCILPLIQIYLKHFRPKIIQHDVENMSEPHAPLWLNFDGTQDDKIGRRVTNFFQRHLHIHINTTRIRGLVENESQAMFNTGKITQEQRTSIQNLNGHTSQITTDYYLKTSRLSDGNNVRNVLLTEDDRNEASNVSNLLENDNDMAPTPTQSVTPNRLDFNEDIDNQYSVFMNSSWGKDHPDYTRSRDDRAQWTSDEIDYIANWIETSNLTNIKGNNVASRCLKHILKDNYARRIFHARHIINSGRFAHGVRVAFQQLSGNHHVEDIQEI